MGDPIGVGRALRYDGGGLGCERLRGDGDDEGGGKEEGASSGSEQASRGRNRSVPRLQQILTFNFSP